MPTSPIDRLIEARPVYTSALADAIRKLPGYKSVDSWYMVDGSVMLLRADDGQAYEVSIRPASLAQFGPFKAHYGAGAPRGLGKRQPRAKENPPQEQAG